jgi:CDP-diacylglycerol--glycerol-3-phosphate 3-phosphatidyltransferase
VNLPNLLTCSRVVFAALFAAFLFSANPFGKAIALFFFIIASLTDYWDGRIARGRGMVSQFGKLMDPIADKILTLAAFFSFWYLGLLPLWMVLVVVARDLTVTTARFFMPATGSVRAARMSGKQKTVVQILFIIGVLLYLIARQLPDWQPAWDETANACVTWGMGLVVLITVWSGVRVLIKRGPEEKKL